MKNNKTEPIPVMDYRQYRRARKLVHECCNYIAGNCIALDDGEECICVQSISYSLLCRWFRAAVLPQDKELETALFHRLNAKKCAVCGALFTPGSNRAKSYFAGCIANALMEREIPVCMTNFALILGDLAASFEGRNEYISRLCSFPLLILDDFGMERGTEYGLEQVYNVIDSRYRSGRPLIVTTNLTLEDLQHPEDTAHARIYDRLIEMCSPVRFTGSNFRKATAQEKMGQLKKLMNRKESRL